jgi:hypothetical protein
VIASRESRSMQPSQSRSLWQRIHRDERGAVSLETILIIAAIAIPILIFILKFGWPKIRDYFNTGMENLENEGSKVQQGTGN